MDFIIKKNQRVKWLTCWFKKYDFNSKNIIDEPLEKIREELLNIKGVGNETADSILLYALNMPMMVVTSYTKRLVSRTGHNIPKKIR